jgi:hypothetical protein
VQTLRSGAESRRRWTLVEPTTIAVLDERLEGIACHWPSLMTALVIRGPTRPATQSCSRGVAGERPEQMELPALAMLAARLNG